MGTIKNMGQNKLVFFIVLFIFSSCKKKEMNFISLPQFSYIDSILIKGKMLKNKSDVYIINNFRDNIKSEKLIDSFVNHNKDINLNHYENYSMVFYKSSDETNIEHLKKNPRDLDRYSQQNDWIYTFIWSKGLFVVREKIRNGEIIEPKNKVRIEDID